MEDKKESKLRVVKDEEVKEETPAGKPTPEEVAQYKTDFDAAMKDFAESRFAISDPGQFPSNDVAMFLLDYLKKYALWSKTGWMGIIKMNDELNKAMQMDNEKTGLTLDYQSLEFCGYMLMNPGNIGYDSALEFEKIADKYSQIMVKVGQKVEEARGKLRDVQYLQEKWAAGEQGFYLAELEEKAKKEAQEKEGEVIAKVEGKVVEMTSSPAEDNTTEA